MDSPKRSYEIDIITSGVNCNVIEVECTYAITKVSHKCLMVDGEEWRLPLNVSIEFGDVWEVPAELTNI